MLAVEGLRISLAELRAEYDDRNGAGAFSRLSHTERASFLEAFARKELLLRVSRDSLGPLGPPHDRLARQEDDRSLREAWEERLVAPVLADTAGTRALVERSFRTEARLSWLIHPSRQVAEEARRRIEAGEPFEVVAREISAHDSSAARGGAIGWRNAAQLGPDLAGELWIEPAPPGTLTGVLSFPRGSEIYRVEERRPFYPESEAVEASLFQTARQVRMQARIEQWRDSLFSASGFEIDSALLPVVRERMNAYWDSLAAHGHLAAQVGRDYEPPAALFTEDELGRTLYRWDGKELSLAAYLDRLREVAMTLWPSGPDDAAVRERIEQRVLAGRILDLARAAGLHETREMRARFRRNEEKQRLEMLEREWIGPRARPAAEEVRAVYDAETERFRHGDEIRLSALRFRSREEADRFAAEARGMEGIEWAPRIATLRSDPGVEVVAAAEPYDPHGSVPAPLAPLVDAGWRREEGSIVGPLPLPDGGWGVARVVARRPAGVSPFPEVAGGIRRRLTQERMARLVEELLARARERYGLKLHPEALGGVSPSSSSNRSSSRTGTPSSRALASFEPGASPATT